MKVLWFIESLSLGGQQTQSINLIKELKKRTDLFIEVAYFNNGPLEKEFTEVADLIFQIKELNVKSYQNPFYILKILNFLRKTIKVNNYDIVISNGIISFGLTSIVKLFLSFKHIRLLGGPLLDIEPTYEKYFHKILPFHKRVDVVFGWGGKNVRENIRYNKKLKIMPPAVDTSMFFSFSQKEKLQIREKFEIKEDEIVIGWVGRIAANMQIDNTIKLGAELKRRGINNFKLLIVGGGNWESEMLQMIEDLNLKSHCIYLGWQPMEDIPKLFQAMDIVPLLEDDPVGGSIVREAMATGALVLTVDGVSKGQTSWVNNNKNGILVSSRDYLNLAADVIEDYALNKKKYDIITKNGVIYAKEEMSFFNQSEFIYKEGILND